MLGLEIMKSFSQNFTHHQGLSSSTKNVPWNFPNVLNEKINIKWENKL
jgi:hypothetical protein